MNRNFATYGAFLVLFVVRVYSVFYIELNFSEKLCGFIFFAKYMSRNSANIK